MYVATASGGLFKTTNGGTTWTPIFDHESTISIGNIAVDPHNPDVVWLGAGEANARNSVSFGDGVYKTLDGGKTWRNLGLRDTHHISRVVAQSAEHQHRLRLRAGPQYRPQRRARRLHDHRRRRDVEEDALHRRRTRLRRHGYRRQQSQHPLRHHVEVRPQAVDASSRAARRPACSARSMAAAPGQQLTTGLPKGWGRIGVRVAPSNSNVVYVIGESNEGTLYRSDDRGDHFHMMTKNPVVVGRGLYYSHLTIDPTDENRIYTIGMRLSMSIDGGRTIRPASRHHSRRLSHRVGGPQESQSRVAGAGRRHRRQLRPRRKPGSGSATFRIGQFYQVFADNREPFYYLSGGLQDNGSWTGPSRNHTGAHPQQRLDQRQRRRRIPRGQSISISRGCTSRKARAAASCAPICARTSSRT